MEHNYFYEYNRIKLIPLKENNIERLRILRNKKKHFFACADEISKEAQIKWYDNYLKKPDDYMFEIEEVHNPGTFIGAVSIYDVNYEVQSCEFGRIIIDHEIASVRGLGLDVTRAACLFSFEFLGVKSIILYVYKNNLPAIKTYKKAGFIIKDITPDMYLMELDKTNLQEEGFIWQFKF